VLLHTLHHRISREENDEYDEKDCQHAEHFEYKPAIPRDVVEIPQQLMMRALDVHCRVFYISIYPEILSSSCTRHFDVGV